MSEPSIPCLFCETETEPVRVNDYTTRYVCPRCGE